MNEHAPSIFSHRAPISAPLRVMLVINDMGFGGAEIQVADLARRLARRGHSVAVVVLARFLDFEAELNGAGVETHALGMSYGRPSLRGALRLMALTRRFRPDVVHAHLLGAAVMCRLARTCGAHIPFLITTSHSPFERSLARYAVLGASDFLNDLSTNVCQAGIDEFVARGAVRRDKVLLTPNGIDLTRFAPDPSRRASLRAAHGIGARFAWLAVGSFRTEQKDYGNLARAAARLREGGAADFEILVCGVGALEDQKKELVRSMGLGDRVRFLGLRRDVGDLMLAADGYVMSSAWEAFPIVLLEAAASGLPAVVTDVGGNSQIVEDTVTGYVVPPKDDAALAGAMGKMMSLSPRTRSEMGQRARERVASRFEIERIVDGWERIYRDGPRARREARS